MPALLAIILHAAAILLGATIIAFTALSAIRSFVLARSARDPISSLVFVAWRIVFNLRAANMRTYEDRDRVMALLAPVALLTLPIIWLALMSIGYMFVYVGMGLDSFYDAYTLSGSALTTLGFARQNGWLFMAVEFSESAVGLILVALLISYLPTMYSAFSARESAVTMLEVRAGSPPSAVEMINRAHRIRGLDLLSEMFEEWEQWFSDVEESHTSLPALVFFRSPKADRHWVTAAGAVLDGAALFASSVDVPFNPQAALCLRAGYLALRAIADFFQMEYDPTPQPDDSISISRAEFDAVWDQLAEQGVPLKADRDQCWRDFAGWRVNYDNVLLQLAALTMAPYAPWISDRSVPGMGAPRSWRNLAGRKRRKNHRERL